ncbi:MAG: hypothetical protein SV775_09530 [Thermodesulfobacteriota bacterium]|nr:hypothetical protein [Thermodesulfobacteriota bacterium]
MRMKSTGLGATELMGELISMEKQMDGILMIVKVRKPVVWTVRVFMQQDDIRKTALPGLKPSTIWYLIWGMISSMVIEKLPFKIPMLSKPEGDQHDNY